MHYTKNEIIGCYGWRDIYESSYDISKPDIIPSGKVIFCEACNLREFFFTLKNHPERKIILMSCESDYGVVYQAEQHSNEDLYKCYYRVRWDEINPVRNSYMRLQFTAADADRCHPNDKFAAKIDGMTACTFNEIPDNVVHWFCANCMINEPRVSFLPFGVNSQGDLGLFESICKEKIGRPEKLFYVNLDTNTYDRYQFKNYWAEYIKQPGVEEWASFVQENVPICEFYNHIRNHEFTCCHAGNGGETFRLYETLYLERFPIVKYDRLAHNMAVAGLPIIAIKHWFGINKSTLNNIKNELTTALPTINWDILKKSYWFDKIWQMSKEI